MEAIDLKYIIVLLAYSAVYLGGFFFMIMVKKENKDGEFED